MNQDTVIYVQKDEVGRLQEAWVWSEEKQSKIHLPLRGVKIELDPGSTGSVSLDFHAARVRVLETP